MKYVVYRIEITVNNSERYFYIGKTSSYFSRKEQHAAALKANKHHCKGLQGLFNKFGVYNAYWNIEVLKEAKDPQSLKIMEDEYINLYRSLYGNKCVNTSLPKRAIKPDVDRYVRKTYTFYNYSLNIVEECSKSELAKKYDLDKGNISKHCKGSSRYSHVGHWVKL